MSFNKCFNVTIPLFGYLVAQSSQRNNISKQQIVLTTNLSEFLTLNKCFKGFVTSICNITIVLQN